MKFSRVIGVRVVLVEGKPSKICRNWREAEEETVSRRFMPVLTCRFVGDVSKGMNGGQSQAAFKTAAGALYAKLILVNAFVVVFLRPSLTKDSQKLGPTG